MNINLRPKKCGHQSHYVSYTRCSLGWRGMRGTECQCQCTMSEGNERYGVSVSACNVGLEGNERYGVSVSACNTYILYGVMYTTILVSVCPPSPPFHPPLLPGLSYCMINASKPCLLLLTHAVHVCVAHVGH